MTNKTDNIEKAAARFRKSRAEYVEGEKADGHAAGRRWVLEDAEYPEVQALAEFKLSGYPEHAWSELYALLLDKNPDLDDSDLRVSLFGYGGEDHDDPSPAWVEGFLEGAKEAWAEVRVKV
jgi:hypothetical protein